ncbi:glycosyltransferase family 2 protein [Crocosphaera sp.]|uniref:glycosyltransferase family 2 protein n=1 Tax=Crocosphaera sp. TaxID=2729996 RepID=UPI003F23CC88|nr:glycosyltransferase family 2 protein [Crocosphaera sp.]
MVKVSIVIPAYNAMKYLPETLDNLLQQTYKDFEVIIVNDGSTDNIKDWLTTISDDRVRLISQENKGLAGARNTGIEKAKGDYIAFLDADDLWEPTKIEKQVKVLDNNPGVGLVYTGVAIIDSNGIPTGRIFQEEVEGYIWKELTQKNFVGCGSVAVVKKECFEKVGNFDKNLGSFVEDWDMWLRIAVVYPFKVIKEPLVYYRQHPNSASKKWDAMEKSFEIVIEKAFKTAPKELQYLKSQSYGLANFVLAWKPLQTQNPDYQKAIHFQKNALDYYPKLRFSKENFRLSIAIFLMRFFGKDAYSQILSIVYPLRRFVLSVYPTTAKS